MTLYPSQGERGMEKEHLISIGKLSEITNTHVKSLRYYEKLGILSPAYVNPESGYRYYSFSQISLVEAIQLCVDLDIPLKNFSDFRSEQNHSILYNELLKAGKRTAEIKINSIFRKLKHLEDIRLEITRAESCYQSKEPIKCNMPSKTCWIIAYSGYQNGSEYYNKLNQAILEAQKCGFQIGYDAGLLLVCQGHVDKQYLYVDLLNIDQQHEHDNIIHIPASNFLCMKTTNSNIKSVYNVFPDLFNTKEDKYVIETELFIGEYDYENPIYELRCSLPE